jgi:hypothetical protein
VAVAGACTSCRRIDNPPQIANLPHEYPASTQKFVAAREKDDATKRGADALVRLLL